MEKLKEKVPVLFSPRFWGIVLAALGMWLTKYGFVFSSEALGEFLTVVSGSAAAVGTVDRSMEYLGKKK